MKCLNCDTEFSPKTKRAKFCSDRCRVEFNRNNVTKTVDTESPVTELSVTETDRLFESKSPGYYSFSDKVYSRTCIAVSGRERAGCGKPFKTRLQLLRFCSPEHMNETLAMLGGKYAK